MTITIVGLGPGDPALLTRRAWEVLSNASEIYVRTARHPTLDGLPSSVKVKSFDASTSRRSTSRTCTRKWPTRCCDWARQAM